MQVKKFEARSMKEALEMVKSQLGPDAIILSARDNKKFGLLGEGSVEITAAVSETTLRKKQFTESRLTQSNLKTFSNSSATRQKAVIEKMVDHHVKANEAAKTPPARRPLTVTRYIDINEDGAISAASQSEEDQAAERIKSAAAKAWQAMNTNESAQSQPVTPIQKRNREKAEILTLKNEINSLKNIISSFKNMPQNFIASHPGADYGLPYDLSFMFEKLLSAGISQDIIVEILTQAQKELPAIQIKKKAMVDAWVAKHILKTTKVCDEKNHSQVHLFVGSPGHGKTTTMIKMASQFVVKENKKVAIFSADTMKVGASDQLKIYAQILNVPFMLIKSRLDWERIYQQIKNFDVILVDYPGLNLKSMEEINFLKNILPPEKIKHQTHLVMSATSKDNDALEMARRYRMTQFDDFIFTALDESTQSGVIYNLQHKLNTPLHSFGIGHKVPEDLEPATKERVLDLIFKITNWKQRREEAHGQI